MQELCQVYNKVKDSPFPGSESLMPLHHIRQTVHKKVYLNEEGDYVRMESHANKTKVIIPCTEESANRTGIKANETPHPFVDKIKLITSKEYEAQLKCWSEWSEAHPSIKIIYKYITKNTLINDLKKEQQKNLLDMIDRSKDELIKKIKPWSEEDKRSLIDPEKLKEKLKSKDWNDKTIKDVEKFVKKENAKMLEGFVSWVVECKGEPNSETWNNKEIHKNWIKYCLQKDSSAKGLCYITGKQAILVKPKRYRKGVIDSKYNAKIISEPASPWGIFTFLGKSDDCQSVNVSSEVMQKSHSALEWLINRQGFKVKDGSQRIVSWATSGKIIKVEENFFSLSEDIEEESLDHSRDMGESFALDLKRYLIGYKSQIPATDHIMIMGLEAPTDGRIAITYYQKYMAHHLLENLKQWEEDFSWFLRCKKNSQFIERLCAPALKSEMWRTIYGENVKPNLKQNFVNKVLPCIAQRAQLPFDIVQNCIKRVSNRNSFKDKDQYLEALGIACSLYKGYHCRKKTQRGYKMSLEEDRTERDYLYGRLLAVAEKIESIALSIQESKHPTAAERYMLRFSQRPSSTWKIIHDSLIPYFATIIKKYNKSYLESYRGLMDNIGNSFESMEDFKDDKKLEGEYLLGFYCQRYWLEQHKPEKGKWVLKNERGDDK